MTTKPARQLTSRGEAMRARIVAAAADLVHRDGAARTSLDEVRAAAGASKSQLYHYFADKDALVREVIALQTARVLGAQQPDLDSFDSMEGLRRWRDRIVALVRQSDFRGGCPVGSLASELADQSEPARTRLVASFATWLDRLEGGLRRMQARGELAATADPRDLAVAILGAHQGGSLLAKTLRSARPMELALDMALAEVARHLA